MQATLELNEIYQAQVDVYKCKPVACIMSVEFWERWTEESYEKVIAYRLPNVISEHFNTVPIYVLHCNYDFVFIFPTGTLG